MTPKQLTMKQLLELPPTMTLEKAGLAWGYGRTKSHELARAENFPCEVLRKGKQYIVTKAHLFTALGIPLEFLFTADPEVVRARMEAKPQAGAA
jgi:hypothetical protein